MSDTIPSSAIVVAAVLRKSCGVQAPPPSNNVPAALLRFFSTSVRVLSLICLDMDFRFAWFAGSRAGKHHSEYAEVNALSRLNWSAVNGEIKILCSLPFFVLLGGITHS